MGATVKGTWRGLAIGMVATVVVVGCTALMGCSADFACTKDYDCPSTEVCNVETGTCEATGPGYCDTDDDCPRADDRCDAHQCVSP